MKEQYIKTTASRTQYFSDAAMTIRHREDGPAVEYNDGEKAWYLNGKCHREDGPAVEDTDGYKEWYLNGKLHREDGPAIEYTNGYKAWYINDKSLTEEEFNARMNPVELTLEYIKTTAFRTQYFSDAAMTIRHREDGPAIEYADGGKLWYLRGVYHREDGPAVEWPNGYKEWRLNGELHREDGPAVEWVDGSKDWYLNDERVNEDGTPYIDPVGKN
jgi:hypothetical protein